ncbi:MAG: hypothetical protein ACLP6E_11065 [Acidimicrobiales bacterium]
MKRVPGRATSLASVGLLLALSVLVAALGSTPGAGSGGPRTGSSLGVPAQVHRRSGAPDRPLTRTTAPPTAVRQTVSQSFRCMYPEGPGGRAPRGVPELTSSEPGIPQVTATTFCRGSNWYVSFRVGARTSEPFEVPDDPPIPPHVTVQRFVTVGPGNIPAALVERESFGSASIYELFTSTGNHVAPVLLVPGDSPVLLLQSDELLDGAGFTCTPSASGEVIRQYEWYIINPLTLRTTARGDIEGDPEVYLETTIYTAVSARTFTSSTDAIVATGYTTVESFSGDTC